jgi:CRP-like cAMP-binding protein
LFLFCSRGQVGIMLPYAQPPAAVAAAQAAAMQLLTDVKAAQTGGISARQPNVGTGRRASVMTPAVHNASASTVRVHSRPIKLLGPGSIFGEVACLSGEGLRTASMRAIQPTFLLVLDKESLLAVMAAHAGFAAQLRAMALERAERVEYLINRSLDDSSTIHRRPRGTGGNGGANDGPGGNSSLASELSIDENVDRSQSDMHLMLRLQEMEEARLAAKESNGGMSSDQADTDDEADHKSSAPRGTDRMSSLDRNRGITFTSAPTPHATTKATAGDDVLVRVHPSDDVDITGSSPPPSYTSVMGTAAFPGANMRTTSKAAGSGKNSRVHSRHPSNDAVATPVPGSIEDTGSSSTAVTSTPTKQLGVPVPPTAAATTAGGSSPATPTATTFPPASGAIAPGTLSVSIPASPLRLGASGQSSALTTPPSSNPFNLSSLGNSPAGGGNKRHNRNSNGLGSRDSSNPLMRSSAGGGLLNPKRQSGGSGAFALGSVIGMGGDTSPAVNVFEQARRMQNARSSIASDGGIGEESNQTSSRLSVSTAAESTGTGIINASRRKNSSVAPSRRS